MTDATAPVPANATAMPSAYFSVRPDLRIGEGEIVLVSNCRNELQRLPYFLEYYRRLGVDRFLIIDNNSDDGTTEYLKAQPDVEYFFTDASYRGALSGRLWTQELADTYAVDRWVLTVDADELLVYPGVESVSLPELCAYLDEQKVRGLFAFMLDMYADVPLSEAVYVAGSDFLDTCRWFEVDSYHLTPGQYPPFLKVEGGPRSALYGAHPDRKGPESTKVPLVRWQRGFSYIASTHSHRHLPLADISGTLLHFKFFSLWSSVVQRDAARGDQIGFYDTYAEAYGKADPTYHRPESIEYRDAAQLVELGVIRTTPVFAEWIAAARLDAGLEHVPGSEALEPAGLSEVTHLDLRAFSQVWGLVNNPHIPAYFGADDRVSPDARRHFVNRISRQIALIDAKPDHLLVEMRHPALHLGRSSNLEIALYVDDSFAAATPFDGSVPGMRVETTSMHPNTYRWDVDLAGFAGHADATISLYVRDTGEVGRVGEEILDADRLVFVGPWSSAGEPADADRYQGAIEAVVDGRLIGWVYDRQVNTFGTRLELRVNGRLVGLVNPREPRPDLRPIARLGARHRTFGFDVALPLGFFEADGPVDFAIEMTIAGTNSPVPHSPARLPAGQRSAWWDESSGSWRTRPPRPASAPPWRRVAGRLKRALRGARG